MRIHYLQHVPFEDPGCIRLWAVSAGHSISATRFYRDYQLLAMDELDWLIIMGGPMSIYDENKHPWLRGEKHFIRQAIQKGKVVIGICLGAQLVADVLGAKVYPNGCKEIGWFPVQKTKESSGSAVAPLIPDGIPVFHWHGETFDVPSGAVHLLRSEACENQAFIYHEHVLGFQFHLEITRRGLQDLIENCGHEIIDGPFIQKPDFMLADKKRFSQINHWMIRLLDDLANNFD
jgi:GMP synthase (glutamine-hydrolysing)